MHAGPQLAPVGSAWTHTYQQLRSSKTNNHSQVAAADYFLPSLFFFFKWGGTLHGAWQNTRVSMVV